MQVALRLEHVNRALILALSLLLRERLSHEVVL